MSSQPRESMRVLPGFLQPFLTWLTGMPLRDQRPRLRWTPVARALAAVVMTVAGVGLGLAALSGPWSLLPLVVVSWLLTINGMRDLYAVIEHYCIHHTFARRRAANRWVGELISTVLVAAPFDAFRKDHLTHHVTTRTDDDPDVIFLRGTGFRPGMSRDEFLRYIARAVV